MLCLECSIGSSFYRSEGLCPFMAKDLNTPGRSLPPFLPDSGIRGGENPWDLLSNREPLGQGAPPGCDLDPIPQQIQLTSNKIMPTINFLLTL
jgi:hypothetical protein